MLGVPGQLAQVVLALVRQQREQLLRQVVRQVGDDVGCVVRLDLRQHGGGARQLHVLQRRRLQVLAHLLQRVRRQPGIEGGEHGGALAVPHLADDVGDVGGVQLGELGERLHEVEPREPERDEVDVLPGHEVAAAARQAARQEPQAEAPDQRAVPGVHPAHHQVARVHAEHDILYPHERPPADIQHLVVQERVHQRQLLGTERGRLQVGGATCQAQGPAVHVQLGHLPPRGAHLVVVALDDEAGDGRSLLGRQGKHVEQLADGGAAGVHDVHVLELGERQLAAVVHGRAVLS